MITGGIKFFDRSKILDATASAPISGDASVTNLLNANRETFYRSVGSTDLITEEIEIVFSEDRPIDRLFLIDFNGKNFNVQYDVSGVWTDFANVIDLDGSQATVTETAYARDTYYAEFDQVTTGKIRIQITETQVANAQKYINQVIVTTEKATLVGYPEIKDILSDRRLRVKKTLNKNSVQKSLEVVTINLAFKNYPSSSVYNVDIDAMLDLHDSEDNFLVWLCGGRFDSPYFRYTIRGFRLQDVYEMQVASAYKLGYRDNIYTNPINLATIKLIEAI